MKPRFALYGALVGLAATQAALAVDVRVTEVELSFFARERGGWVQADEPAKGGMLAIRCTYELVAEPDERPARWLLAFIRDEQELRRARGGGLVDADTGRASRTWYGLIAEPGAYEVGCVADPDGELAESDEGNNRVVQTLTVPGEGRGVMRRTPLVGATAGQAAAARGQPPALDLEVTDDSGIRRAGDRRSTPSGSLTSAVVGETLLVDCRFRAHVDSVNSEKVELPSWTARIEREGAVTKEEPGLRDFTHALGTTSLQSLVEGWTPTEPGRYVFRCLLDPAASVAETDRANNARELNIEIVPAETPAAAQVAPPNMPEFPPAQLGFVAYTHEPAEVIGPTEQTVYGNKGWYDKPNLKVVLMWNSPVASQFEWRWQAALWPFPAASYVEPQALLADGEVTGNVFTVNLSAFPPLGTLPKTGKEGPPGNISTAAVPPTAGSANNAPHTGSAAAVMPTGSAAVPQTAAARAPAAAAASGARTMPDLSSRPGDARAAVGRPQAAAPAPTQAASALPMPDFTGMPVDIYLRIVPIANGKPAGTPSNFVVAHYVPDVDPVQQAASETITRMSEKAQKLAEVTEAAAVFDLALMSFEQPIFAQSEKWGCVKIVKNPYFGKPGWATNQELPLGHPVTLYAPGQTVCPQLDEQYMEKDLDEQVWEGVKGFGFAWDGLVGVFDYAKTWVAQQLAENLPCEWLGEGAESDCESAAAFVAKAAINVGLAAAGVPPTLPDLEGLGELAKGEVVNAAVEYTCKAIENEGGTCTPEMRAAIAKVYAQGVDEMQKMATRQLSEPGCGNAEEAMAHGKKPLPCFTSYPGVEVEPAPGAVDTSPAAIVTLTRIKPAPGFPMECRLTMGMTFTNENVPGFPGYPPTGELWSYGAVDVPAVPVGQKANVRVEMGFRQPFKQVGHKGQSVDWWHLLFGSTASLRFNTITTHVVVDGPNGPTAVYCGNDLQRTVQVPQQVTQPWNVL